MNGYIKECNRGGVYNRLVLDSAVRKKKQDNIERQVSIKTDSASKPRTKIENILMQKHAKSQAKINSMRVKQQLKESQGLKSVPKINKISKEIAELLDGTSSDPISLYTAKLLNASKSTSGAKLLPKQSFLSLLDLEEGKPNRPNSQILREQYDQFLPQEQKSMIIPEYAAIKFKESKEQATERDKEIEELRQAVFNRCKVMEPEEPPVEILKMSVIDRNAHWLQTKNNRLKKQKELQSNKETIGCTFSPRLTPRLNLTRDSRRNQSINNSYSTKNTYKVPSTSGQKKEQLVSQKSESKTLLYKALSPHERTLSQGRGSTLLSHARPMVSYKV